MWERKQVEAEKVKTMYLGKHGYAKHSSIYNYFRFLKRSKSLSSTRRLVIRTYSKIHFEFSDILKKIRKDFKMKLRSMKINILQSSQIFKERLEKFFASQDELYILQFDEQDANKIELAMFLVSSIVNDIRSPKHYANKRICLILHLQS